MKKGAERIPGYILNTGCTLEPFNEDCSEAMIGGERLIYTQERAMRYAGVEPAVIRSPAGLGPGPAVILMDRVYVSDKLMRDFVGSAPRDVPAILGLKRCVSVDYNLAIQDVVDGGDGNVYYSCFMVPDASAYSGEADLPGVERRLVAEARRTVVKMREISATLRLPTLGRQARVLKFPITSSVAAHVVHWVTLLRLNSLQWGIRWMEYMRGDVFGMTRRTLKAIGAAFPFNPYKIMSGINVIGERCQIHPTAYIEASFVGDNAKVGAGATIRNSIIGDGAVIGDHAYLMNSVFGQDCYLTENTALIWCTCYPGSSIANVKIQMSVIGRESYLNMWCSFLDAKFLGDVMVEHRGKLVSSGTSFLGSCIGHNCTMGGKVLIMPGRSIPNGTFMVTRPDESIVHIPPDLPAGVPLIRDNGTLVPLKR